MIKAILINMITDRYVQVTGTATTASVILNIIEYSKAFAAILSVLTGICLFITALIAAKKSIKNQTNQEKPK